MTYLSFLDVIVISSVYPPEPVVSAQTSAQVVAGLASKGLDVRVVTSFPGRPGGRVYPGFRRVLYDRRRHPDGPEIVRCFSAPSSDSSAPSRLLENLVFGFTSAALLAVSPRPAVIYSNTWPIFASGLMALVASLRRIPYVVSIQDVYPESFSAQGRGSKDGLAFRIMRWIDRQVALRARHVIVISEAFAEIYTKNRGVPRERVSVVPNWVNGEEQACNEEDAALLRRRFSIPADAFLVAYGGNIGVAAGAETFIQAFAYLGKNVYGLIAGEGSQSGLCRRLAGEIAPDRIAFLSPWPVELTMPLYRAADLLVLPTRGSQSLASVPSKMIRYMLSGRPVLAMGLPGSDLAGLIDASQCGWLIPPDDPIAIAEKITEIREIPQAEMQQRGQSGRRYALDHLTSQACLPKVIKIIEEAAT